MPATPIDAGELVHADELTTMHDDFESLGKGNALSYVTEVVHEMTDVVEDLAKRYAPRRTGELVGSIGAEKGEQAGRAFGEVYATATHGAAVEFGTWQFNIHAPKSGTYEIRPVHAQALRFEVEGEVVFAQVVRHPGVQAQPYLTPAVSEIEGDFIKQLADLGADLIISWKGRD